MVILYCQSCQRVWNNILKDLMKEGEFYLYGFDMIPPVLHRVIARLAELSQGVHLYLPLESSRLGLGVGKYTVKYYLSYYTDSQWKNTEVKTASFQVALKRTKASCRCLSRDPMSLWAVMDNMQ